MQVAGPDANRRDILDGGFEDGILVACMAVISWWKFLGQPTMIPHADDVETANALCR